MLALLWPWQMLQDLKAPIQTFNIAFDDFICNCSSTVQNILENIQYYHECSETACSRYEVESCAMAGDIHISIQDHDAQVSENVNILEEDIILTHLKRYPAMKYILVRML